MKMILSGIIKSVLAVVEKEQWKALYPELSVSSRVPRIKYQGSKILLSIEVPTMFHLKISDCGRFTFVLCDASTHILVTCCCFYDVIQKSTKLCG